MDTGSSSIQRVANRDGEEGKVRPGKAVNSLSEMEKGYREFKETQQEDRRQWIRNAVEALVLSTVERIDGEEMQEAAKGSVAEETASIKKGGVGESEEVVAEVMLQHK